MDSIGLEVGCETKPRPVEDRQRRGWCILQNNVTIYLCFCSNHASFMEGRKCHSIHRDRLYHIYSNGRLICDLDVHVTDLDAQSRHYAASRKRISNDPAVSTKTSMLTSKWLKTKNLEKLLYYVANTYCYYCQARKLYLKTTGFSQRSGGERQSLDHPDHLKPLCPKVLVETLIT